MCQVATFDAAQAQTLPTRAERRRVTGRTRARARDCSSRASWELCSRALTVRAAGACLFFGWKACAASARPRLPGQAVAERHSPRFVTALHRCVQLGRKVAAHATGELNSKAVVGSGRWLIGKVDVQARAGAWQPQMVMGSQKAPGGWQTRAGPRSVGRGKTRTSRQAVLAARGRRARM